jgi:hypothetical protein
MTPAGPPVSTTSHREKGMPVQSQSTSAGTPSAATGFFAVLRGLLRVAGTGAPSPALTPTSTPPAPQSPEGQADPGRTESGVQAACAPHGVHASEGGRRYAPAIWALGLLLLTLTVTPPAAQAAASGFGSEGEGAGQLTQPFGVASGSVRGGFGTGGEGAGQMQAPRGVAVDQATRAVFVADTEGLRVERWSGGGVFERLWGRGVNVAGGNSCVAGEVCVGGEVGAGAGEFAGFPSGVAVDNSSELSHGSVYVGDGGNSRVQEFTSEGGFVLMFGKNVNGVTHEDVCRASEEAACQRGEGGTGAGAFGTLEHESIAVDSAGVVYVGDENRVQKFSSAGVLLGEIALPGVGVVMGLAVDGEGDMYVVGNGMSGVQKYGPAGVPVGGARDPGASPERAVIALGAAGELFVYDNFQGHVLEYAPDGTQLSSTLFEPPRNGTPSGGLTFGNELGVLYVEMPDEVATLTAPVAGPAVVEGSERVDNVLPTSAVAHALVNPEGAASEYHVEYGLSAAYGESTPVSAPLAGVDEVQSVTVTATGGAFTLSFEGAATGEIPFNASAGEVQAALEGIGKLGAGQVSVGGEAGGPWSVQFTGAQGGQDVPELAAEAGGLTGPEPGAVVATTTLAVSLFDDRAASAALTGLLPGTLYHYRFVVSDGSHTTFGPDQSFETEPAVSVESESVSEVTGESARLEATLNPHGLAGGYRFEYGPTSAYGTSVPEPNALLAAGSEGVPVHVLVQGLAANTLYHYRVVTTNELGTNAGPDHTFRTGGAAATALIDGRQWEMVSPPSKHGGVLEGIEREGAMIQSAEDGHAFTYAATGPISGEAPGSRSVLNTQLMSLRTGPGVWATRDISTPHEEVSGVTVGHRSEYLAFSADLSLGALEVPGSTPLNPALMGERKEHTPYLRASSTEDAPLNTSEFVPLVTEANTPPGTRFAGREAEPPGSGVFIGGTEFAAMTPDAGNVIFNATPPLVEGVAADGNKNLYEWRAGALTFVSGVPAAPATVCGGFGPACAQPLEGASLGHESIQTRGALSNDGSRVVFYARSGDFHLWLRDVVRGETLELDAPQGGVRERSGRVRFQIATGDGSRVFFTDTARLTPDATATPTQPDLYMCDVRVTAGRLSCALSDLSVDPNRNEAAGVLGSVIGIDGTGRYVYFAAAGALTPGARHGGANLYVRDVIAGVTSLVAVLDGGDAPDWAPASNGSDLSKQTAGVSGNGRYLAFMSSASLTGFDNRDVVSGVPDQEVFEYDRVTASLVCVSCGTSGGRPRGMFESPQAAPPLVDRPEVWRERWLAGSIPGWTAKSLGAASYRSRYLFDNGRLFFNSPVGLVAGDGNGRQDVYEYEPSGVPGCSLTSGCVGLLSGGSSSEESAFLDASGKGPGGEEGEDVFFLTAAQLARGTDVDGALDVYDAHVCSTGVPCASGVVSVAPACSTADSCRPAPAPQPDLFGAPASQTFNGQGNVTPGPPPPVPGRGKPKTAAQIRAEKLTKALKACHRINSRKRRLACEKKADKSYGPLHAKGKRATNAKRAANNRRAGA